MSLLIDSFKRVRYLACEREKSVMSSFDSMKQHRYTRDTPMKKRKLFIGLFHSLFLPASRYRKVAAVARQDPGSR